MPDNEIVQGLWFYGDLPLLQQLSIASFLANGHDYHLYTYGPVGKVPPGTTLRDAAELMPEVKVFKDRGEKGYAAFADGFRYALLLERGGWWVDTDVVCLKFFDFPEEYVFASEHVPGENRAVPNNAILKAPAGAPVLQYALDVCETKDPKQLVWAELGPALMADVIPRFSLSQYVVPPETFCPVPWFQFHAFLTPRGLPELPETTFAVHLWNTMWRRQQCDTNAAYHPLSAYEGWKLKFLGGAPGAQQREAGFLER